MPIIGIQAKFECGQCGNLLTVDSTIMKMSGGHWKFQGPLACGCGCKNNFTITEFKQMETVVYDSNKRAFIVDENEAQAVKQTLEVVRK